MNLRVLLTKTQISFTVLLGSVLSTDDTTLLAKHMPAQWQRSTCGAVGRKVEKSRYGVFSVRLWHPSRHGASELSPQSLEQKSTVVETWSSVTATHAICPIVQMSLEPPHVTYHMPVCVQNSHLYMTHVLPCHNIAGPWLLRSFSGTPQLKWHEKTKCASGKSTEDKANYHILKTVCRKNKHETHR